MKRLFAILITCTIFGFNAYAQECVDLGLSVNWATYNVGATSVEEVGIPFVVGTTIKWERESTTLDNLVVHREDFSGNPEYDAATALWGKGWRTATNAEWRELVRCCKWKKSKVVTGNGLKIPGTLVTGPNGNSIFLPNTLPYTKRSGIYQTSTPWQSSGWIETYYIAGLSGLASFSSELLVKYHHGCGVYIRPVINK